MMVQQHGNSLRKALYLGILVHLVGLHVQGTSATEPDLSEVEITATGSNDMGIHLDEGTGSESMIGEDKNLSKATIPPHMEECGIWLAPSAIEGAGLGMYAGRDYEPDDELQIMGDPVIPIVDKFLHNGRQRFKFLWDDYIWNGWVVGTDMEAYDDGEGASPGFGSTANSFIPLINVEEGTPKRDNGGLHRSRDPGAGAFTFFYDRQNYAKRFIHAGEEFYVDYGEHWFIQRDFLGPVPLRYDLDRASALFGAFRRLKASNSDIDPAVFDDAWDTFVRGNNYPESRVFGSFHHDDEDELDKLEKAGSMKNLRVQDATKSLEWLLQYGTCGDHMYGSTSTLPQAGRGAFASRDLPEGTIVAQLPLIHITERFRLNMFHFESDPYSKRTTPRPPQLLLNYCYGHPESTLLLCPYGPMVNYVNHNQTQANVKITWADPARGNFMPHLLNNTLKILERDNTAKLAFEMVATRPIAKDEEIFLDYGDLWEEAWQNHLEEWEPVDGADDYVGQDEYNEMVDDESWRTVHELMENPYPSNLILECHAYFWDSTEWKSKSYETIEEEYAEDLKDFGQDHWWECEILSRYENEDGMELYEVVLVDEEEDEPERMTDFPAMAFRLRDRPYTSDVFLENAFRHEIQIRDEMFPKKWRNVPRRASP